MILACDSSAGQHSQGRSSCICYAINVDLCVQLDHDCFSTDMCLSSMHSMQDGKELVFGANVSQTRAIDELQKACQPQPFHRMADHLLRIAGTYVIGTSKS